MARPEVGPVAEDLYSALGFYAERDEELDWPLLCFVAAWTKPLDDVYELGRERDDMPGWAILFDPDNCPAETLPYLAQYVGARLTPGMDEAQRRAEVKEPATWRRGRADSLRTTMAATLTGTKKVVIRERTPEAPDLYVRVLASECPDPAVTERLCRENKVAGLLLDFATFEGFTYADLKAAYETYGAAEEAFATYAELLEADL